MKSSYNMQCFSCNKSIEKGDEITQCIETNGMSLRKKCFTGARWVHQFCLPTGIKTQFYLETLNDFKYDFPDTDIEDIHDIVDNLDYWVYQEPLSIKDDFSKIESSFNEANKNYIYQIEDLTQHLEETISWYRNHATLDQKCRVIRSFIDQDNMDEFNEILKNLVP